ncbi:MAG: ATP-dependent Clp protease adaptor ClpS [Myxococcales bacterium]|nr:MAG: ATP-dependent Clp protease adaptor ClpS [Myxococcales bacterium]
MNDKKTRKEPEYSGDTLVAEKREVKEPKKYCIVFHNDDFTTQEFVIHVLVNFFHKNSQDAHRLMLKVHLEGKAKVGIYTKDIAESKVYVVTSYCRQNGMPLLLTIEQE